MVITNKESEFNMEWLQANAGLVFGLLFSISEFLALVPVIKSNSIFQLVFNWIKGMAGK